MPSQIATFSSVQSLENAKDLSPLNLAKQGKLNVNGKQYDVRINDEGKFEVARQHSSNKHFFSSAKEFFTHRVAHGTTQSTSQQISNALNRKHQENEKAAPSIEEAVRQVRLGADWQTELSSTTKTGRVSLTSGKGEAEKDAMSYLRDPILKSAMKSASGGSIAKEFIHSKDNHISSIDLGGDNIFESQANLIKQAKSEVLLQTFQWEPNSTGANKLLDALQSLADNSPKDANGKVIGEDGKPIKVRVLLDNLVGKGAEHMWKGQERPDFSDPDVFLGLNSAWCKPSREHLLQKFDFELRVHTHSLANTLHSKSLVVDGKSASVTGANVQERNHSAHVGFDTSLKKITQFDFGMTMQGSSVKGLREDFVHNWNAGENKNIQTHKLEKTEQPDLSAPSTSSGVEMAVLTKTPNINLLSNTTSSPQDQAILAAVKNSKESISILSNNFNTPALEKALAEAADRGVKVQVLVPQVANDTRLGNAIAGRTNRQAYEHLKASTKHPENLDLRYFSSIERLKPELFASSKDRQDLVDLAPVSTHAKITLVDGNVAIVGSGNMDKTSWHFAGETNVALFDQGKTQEIYNRAFSPLWNATNPDNLQAEDPNRGTNSLPNIPQAIQERLRYILEDADSDTDTDSEISPNDR